MKRKICLVCLGLILAALAYIYVSYRLNPPGHLELYDFKKEEIGGVTYKVGYLRWHGGTTELEIVTMSGPSGGGPRNLVVEDGDTFTIKFAPYTGWAEFYWDNRKARLRGTGELQTIFP